MLKVKSLLHCLLLSSLVFTSPASLAAEVCNNLVPDKKKLIWADAEYAMSGDTLIIQNQKVRLIGLDAPQKERKQKFNTPGEPLAEESQEYLNKLIANNNLKVGVLYDETRTDKFGRQLVHAFLEDGRNLQVEMLKAGFAIYRPEFNNTLFATCLIEAEQSARDGGYQLWDLLNKNPDIHYPLIDSSKIYAEDEGYRIIRGKVVKVDKSSSHYIINMDTTGIRIPKRAWDNFKYDNLKALQDKEIEVRGQVYHYKGSMFTIIESPFAINRCAQEKLRKLHQEKPSNLRL